MNLPDGVALLATVCNTTPNAVPYTLWFARGQEEYLVDLSDVLNQPGDGGLTGLTSHGDMIYVAVQSSETPRILVLDRHLAPVDVIASPEFRDIHSIHTSGDSLLICSTGTQSVIRIDLADHRTAKLCEFEQVIHLNSACFAGTELLICCHYADLVVPGAVGGGVIAAADRRVVLVGLTQPHSLEAVGDGFLILDSDGRQVIRFDHTGIRQQQALSGFLRGMTAVQGSLFIASSAGRVISRKNPTVPPGRQFWDAVAEPLCIHELDEVTLAVKATHFPLVAGFEIYELLALHGAQSVDPPLERLLVPDMRVIARAYYEAAKRALAEVHQRG